MLDRGIVRTGVPGWMIRFDDGWKELVNDVPVYLRRGIPVSLALNATQVGASAGRMTWDDIRTLIGLARRHGTTLSILSHAATNWTKYLVGAQTTPSNWNMDSYTRSDVLDELDPTLPESEPGVPVTGYVQPGDATPNEWCIVHRELLISCLRELGYNFAIGLSGYPGINATDGEHGSFFTNSNNWPVKPQIGRAHA